MLMPSGSVRQFLDRRRLDSQATRPGWVGSNKAKKLNNMVRFKSVYLCLDQSPEERLLLLELKSKVVGGEHIRGNFI